LFIAPRIKRSCNLIGSARRSIVVGGRLPTPFRGCPWQHTVLSQFGIGLKIIEPGGMKTYFFTRSFDAGRHPRSKLMP
jgi:hypothetical protein